MDRKTWWWIQGLRVACFVLLAIIYYQYQEIEALTKAVYQARAALIGCR